MTGERAAICVYCGSRFGARDAYAAAATATGRVIAEAGWRLVYGAGDVGLMGAVAAAAAQAGGDTFGLIPRHLLDREVGRRDLSRFVVTETMHERKKVMFMNSDAIVVLPGGAGTMDEFFEVLTWRQLGLHGKPILLLDIAGYWAPLVALLDRIVSEGFADPTLASYVARVPDVEAMVAALRDALSERRLSAE